MQDEETKTEIPDYTPVVATEQPEIQTETAAESTREPDTDSLPDERLRLENEAYKKHFDALGEEIAEIRKRFHVEPETPPDKVDVLSGEVTELKSGLNELKSMLENRNNNNNVSAPAQNQNANPFQVYTPPPPPMYGYGYQPVMQPPMFQTTSILPAQPLPYIHTPTYYPMNTTLPQISGNNNSNNNSQNGGK